MAMPLISSVKTWGHLATIVRPAQFCAIPPPVPPVTQKKFASEIKRLLLVMN
jgi:hypothetical protein